jgi:hypothetical protein
MSSGSASDISAEPLDGNDIRFAPECKSYTKDSDGIPSYIVRVLSVSSIIQ